MEGGSYDAGDTVTIDDVTVELEIQVRRRAGWQHDSAEDTSHRLLELSKY